MPAAWLAIAVLTPVWLCAACGCSIASSDAVAGGAEGPPPSNDVVAGGAEGAATECCGATALAGCPWNCAVSMSGARPGTLQGHKQASE